MRFYKTFLAGTALLVAALCLLHTPPANADKKAERLDYLPLNTNSLRIRPSSSTNSAPRISWEYVKQSDGSSTSSATQTFTVTGALATDMAFVTMGEIPSTACYVKSAVMTADTLTVTLSAAPASIVSFNIDIKRTL